jgi:hypothetical protein
MPPSELFVCELALSKNLMQAYTLSVDGYVPKHKSFKANHFI